MMIIVCETRDAGLNPAVPLGYGVTENTLKLIVRNLSNILLPGFEVGVSQHYDGGHFM